MISIPATLISYVTSDDVEFYKRTDRVMRYMQKLFKFEHSILFSFLKPPSEYSKSERLQIPEMNLDTMNVWINSGIYPFVETDYAWYVHEDGFVLDPKLWKKDFLGYDYLGAPWADGVVGNHGFCIESKKLLKLKRQLPFSERVFPPFDGHDMLASDIFLCRTHRKALEQAGVKFAPRDLAMEFSVELIGREYPSLGFHGRNVASLQYAQGWHRIEESEK